jgi:hypothetical protein
MLYKSLSFTTVQFNQNTAGRMSIREIPELQKIIHKLYSKPILTYKMETQTLAKTDKSKIQAMHMTALRSVY